MKNIKKLDVKKVKSTNTATAKARRSLSAVGSKSVAGCPELSFGSK
jgi:hypothetical protein